MATSIIQKLFKVVVLHNGLVLRVFRFFSLWVSVFMRYARGENGLVHGLSVVMDEKM